MDGILVAADDALASFNPKLAALHRFWQAKCGARVLPKRGDIDVTELAPWLGNLMLLQVEEGGRDFFYRVYGTTIAEYFGRDLTGRRTSSLTPEIRQVVGEEYGEAIAHARPYIVTRQRSVHSAHVRMSKLILPLGPERTRVDHLLVGVYLDD